MAIVMNAVSDSIKVISRLDDCVKCSEETYEEYLESLDESALEMEEGAVPVRFVLKSQLDYKSQRRIKQDQVSMHDGAMGVNLGFMMLELRMVLVDIENPGTPLLTFVKGKDGLASEDLVATLESLGISTDLIAARNYAIRPKVPKKN
jgi:hypothetical protein